MKREEEETGELNGRRRRKVNETGEGGGRCIKWEEEEEAE
jgi:hypothetical protein